MTSTAERLGPPKHCLPDTVQKEHELISRQHRSDALQHRHLLDTAPVCIWGNQVSVPLSRLLEVIGLWNVRSRPHTLDLV